MWPNDISLLPQPQTPLQDWVNGLAGIGRTVPMSNTRMAPGIWDGQKIGEFPPESYSLSNGSISGEGLKLPGDVSSGSLGQPASTGWDWGKIADIAFGKQAADGSRTFGAAMPVISGLQSLGNLWLGMQQYGLMKDQLAFSKDSFNKNYRNSVQSYNTQLEGRARARASADPTAESPEAYMAKHGLKG